jgi:hypothetical protein
MLLTANADFPITSAVSSTSACSDTAVFLPGAQDFICYTVHNPYTEPFTVKTISIAQTTAPTNCPVSNLDLSHTAYTGTPTLRVDAHATGVVAEPISMVANTTNQDSCFGAVFQFTNAGTALVTTTTPPTTTTTTTAPTTTTTIAPTSTTVAPTTTTVPATTTTTVPAPLAFTGADIAGMVLIGLIAVIVGGLLLFSSRKRRRPSDVPDGGSQQ